jgi:hypothetical protein
MIDLLREAQLPFLALILLVASGAKLVAREPGRWSFTLVVAAAEGVLGAALLTTRLGVVRLASVVFFATATSVVAERMRRGAEEGCGCFGTLSDAPPGRRGVVRAALMTACAVVAAEVPRSGLEVVWWASPQLLVVLAAEVAFFLALSPELAVVVERSRRHIPCELRDVPLAETYETLRASSAWRGNSGLLTSAEPSEVWRELCHRFVVYPAEIGGQPGDVVFAVPIGGRPRSVRVGVVVDPVGEPHEDPGRLGSPV